MTPALADVISDASWDKLVDRVPELLLFVAFAWIVFRYLGGKEERHKKTIEAIVKTWSEALAAHDAAFLAAMKDGAERSREERRENAHATRETAKECHDRQGESVASMRDLAAAAVRFATAADTLCDVTSRLEKIVDRKAL